MADIRGKTVSLVLGSGGARGLAHIGVIRELVAAGCDIRAIAGASIGALVGGVHAAGKLDEFEEWARAITRLNLVSLLDVTWKTGGLIGGDRVMETLTRITGDKKIEDLPLAYTAVAVDITREKEIWIRTGPLSDAIRASISLPMILTPVILGDAVLVDGGVLNPVPIAPTFGDGTDLTIAVNLGGLPVYAGAEKASGKKKIVPESFPYSESLNKLAGQLGLENKASGLNRSGLLEIADRAFDTMQNGLARQKLAAYPPDHVIEIPRNACGMLDFHRSADMIDLGRSEARKCLETIERRPEDS